MTLGVKDQKERNSDFWVGGKAPNSLTSKIQKYKVKSLFTLFSFGLKNKLIKIK